MRPNDLPVSELSCLVVLGWQSDQSSVEIGLELASCTFDQVWGGLALLPTSTMQNTFLFVTRFVGQRPIPMCSDRNSVHLFLVEGIVCNPKYGSVHSCAYKR